VNTKKTVTLEDAVHRMTGLPAQRLDLKRRGRIAPGYVADIVIMRPESMRDNATFTDPHQYAEGVDDVWVNGTYALTNGELTGKLAGKVIRSKDS
jgi:N-acyl-D-aspartate/D-glutamate deacylase